MIQTDEGSVGIKDTDAMPTSLADFAPAAFRKTQNVVGYVPKTIIR
jgi:hypothetical protein